MFTPHPLLGLFRHTFYHEDEVIVPEQLVHPRHIIIDHDVRVETHKSKCSWFGENDKPCGQDRAINGPTRSAKILCAMTGHVAVPTVYLHRFNLTLVDIENE